MKWEYEETLRMYFDAGQDHSSFKIYDNKIYQLISFNHPGPPVNYKCSVEIL